jgi:hypothetical protein
MATPLLRGAMSVAGRRGSPPRGDEANIGRQATVSDFTLIGLRPPTAIADSARGVAAGRLPSTERSREGRGDVGGVGYVSAGARARESAGLLEPRRSATVRIRKPDR